LFDRSAARRAELPAEVGSASCPASSPFPNSRKSVNGFLAFDVTDGVWLVCGMTVSFEYRGIAQMPFPYVHGGLQHDQMIPAFIEYPLTGIFAWLTARPAWSARSYLVISAPFLGGLGLHRLADQVTEDLSLSV
jgi:hypothetical protein